MVFVLEWPHHIISSYQVYVAHAVLYKVMGMVDQSIAYYIKINSINPYNYAPTLFKVMLFYLFCRYILSNYITLDCFYTSLSYGLRVYNKR